MRSEGQGNQPQAARAKPVVTNDDAARTRRSKEVTKTVEIKILLPVMLDLKTITEHPAYATLQRKTARVPRKKRTLAILLAVGAVFIVGNYFLASSEVGTATDSSNRRGPVKGTPGYKTVLPAGKSIQDLGGWTLVSPPDRDPAFAYIDKIGNTQVNVSQQLLPDTLKPDTAKKIEELAKSFGANEKVTVGNTVVYIGTSEKGPQSVIFSKNDLLILIKSSVRIDSNEWAKYVNSLQ